MSQIHCPTHSCNQPHSPATGRSHFEGKRDIFTGEEQILFLGRWLFISVNLRLPLSSRVQKYNFSQILRETKVVVSEEPSVVWEMVNFIKSYAISSSHHNSLKLSPRESTLKFLLPSHLSCLFWMMILLLWRKH